MRCYGPQRLTAVIDVGANPIDGDTPYKSILGRRLCTVTGFEPQPEGLASLNARKSDLETYLPYVIGDGSPGTLHIAVVPGMTRKAVVPDAMELFLNSVRVAGAA